MLVYDTKAQIVSAGAWLLLAIGYISWTIPLHQTTLIASLLLLTLWWVSLSYQAWGRSGIITYFLIGVVGCTIEGIGIATCRPYGCFSYTDMLWPKFFDTFPLLLVGIRPFLVLSCAHLVPRVTTKRQTIIAWVGILLLLDLALDPVHIAQWIRAYTSWWRHRFGVPLQNFFGRIITGTLSMVVVYTRKNTIISAGRNYCGIAVFVLFWVQFLALILLWHI